MYAKMILIWRDVMLEQNEKNGKLVEKAKSYRELCNRHRELRSMYYTALTDKDRNRITRELKQVDKEIRQFDKPLRSLLGQTRLTK